MNKIRIAVAALSLSAAGFIGIIESEGYTDGAVIPTKNDRPTIGHGSTVYEDGRPVKMGDKITPTRAIILAHGHITKEEASFRRSIDGVKLHQEEYDLYMDWTYQYGQGAWWSSSMRKALLVGEYRQACDALLLYKKSGGFDCSIPGNRICRGVWDRQLARHKKCTEAQ